MIRQLQENARQNSSDNNRVKFPLFSILKTLHGVGHVTVFGFYKILKFPIYKSCNGISKSFYISKLLIYSLIRLIHSRKNFGLPDSVVLINTFVNAFASLQSSKSYKGLRHKQQLPVRGQRTKTNRKTQRRFQRC